MLECGGGGGGGGGGFSLLRACSRPFPYWLDMERAFTTNVHIGPYRDEEFKV